MCDVMLRNEHYCEYSESYRWFLLQYKMSRSSEEVLLIVNNVKNKKCEGALYMMGERMAWMQQSKSTFTVSHNYADIKSKRRWHFWVDITMLMAAE